MPILKITIPDGEVQRICKATGKAPQSTPRAHLGAWVLAAFREAVFQYERKEEHRTRDEAFQAAFQTPEITEE